MPAIGKRGRNKPVAEVDSADMAAMAKAREDFLHESVSHTTAEGLDGYVRKPQTTPGVDDPQVSPIEDGSFEHAPGVGTKEADALNHGATRDARETGSEEEEVEEVEETPTEETEETPVEETETKEGDPDVETKEVRGPKDDKKPAAAKKPAPKKDA